MDFIVFEIQFFRLEAARRAYLNIVLHSTPLKGSEKTNVEGIKVTSNSISSVKFVEKKVNASVAEFLFDLRNSFPII